MSNELARRASNGAVSHRRSPVERRIEAIRSATIEQVTISRAIEGAGEQAMFDVAQVKRTQRELEQMYPEATEELNLIARSTCIAIARSVARFGFDIGG